MKELSLDITEIYEITDRLKHLDKNVKLNLERYVEGQCIRVVDNFLIESVSKKNIATLTVDSYGGISEVSFDIVNIKDKKYLIKNYDKCGEISEDDANYLNYKEALKNAGFEIE